MYIHACISFVHTLLFVPPRAASSNECVLILFTKCS